MTYINDREFTNTVHNNLALRDIYSKLDWVVQNVNSKLGNNIDINNAVDYMAVDSNRRLITIQERFRDRKYLRYSDFTLRYMRPENRNVDRRLSEFFKLNADYMIYGIIDKSKNDVAKAEKFLKYAVIDLRALLKCIDDGLIVIDSNLESFVCVQEKNVMHCPVNANYDKSSTFVPFDIVILDKIAPEVIVIQDGFIKKD